MPGGLLLIAVRVDLDPLSKVRDPTVRGGKGINAFVLMDGEFNLNDLQTSGRPNFEKAQK